MWLREGQRGLRFQESHRQIRKIGDFVRRMHADRPVLKVVPDRRIPVASVIQFILQQSQERRLMLFRGQGIRR